MKNKYIGRKLIDEKDDYRELYDFLISKNMYIDNVFITINVIPSLYYIVNGELKIDSVDLDTRLEKDYIELFNSNNQIFIYPGDAYNKYKYTDYLRMYHEITPWAIIQQTRLKKLERILDEDDK